MPVTKDEKRNRSKSHKDLQNVSSVVVATYTKMTVPQDYELRRLCAAPARKYRWSRTTLAENSPPRAQSRGRTKRPGWCDLDRLYVGRPGRLAKRSQSTPRTRRSSLSRSAWLKAA